MNGTKYPRGWENINQNLQRIRIPNAWIVRSTTTLIIGGKEVYASEHMIKISDPNHEWVLDNK